MVPNMWIYLPIFTYIYPKNCPNVGKYSSTMVRIWVLYILYIDHRVRFGVFKDVSGLKGGWESNTILPTNIGRLSSTMGTILQK